ncbi:FkbM family methyltransferase [Hyphococcus sp. DH-69]|uniref:FkbM family methyltransferase n=1 Tax=Hyphococcus formosus TaxID=3143534 RepID=UPI00398B9BB5
MRYQVEMERLTNQELATLHTSARGHKVVFWNGLLYFVLDGDWPDTHLPSHVKFSKLNDAIEKSGISPGECNDFTGVEFDIIQSMLRTNRDTVLIDGGANYGREGIRYALFRRSLGFDVPTDKPAVIGIEPGPVIHMAQVNVALHNVPEVTLVHAALSNKVGFTQIGVSNTHTLGGSMAVGTHNEWHSMVCRSVTVDSLMEETEAPVFLKMDVQGAEFLVLEGMKETIERQPIAGIFEYAPTIMERMGPLDDFFEILSRIGKVYDLGMNRKQKRALSHAEIKTLTDEIRARPPEHRCTDLLVIDSRLET